MILIGTRGSALATTQSGHIAAALGKLGHQSRLHILRTQGDMVVDRAFTQMQGKGFFTHEIEEALRTGVVDLAVHSLKDLPTEDAAQLQVVAIPAREDPRDTLIVRAEAYDAAVAPLPLHRGARVGTSAVRRIAQLRHLRRDLVVSNLRGNVPTRLQKLLAKDFEAIVLAQAGLNRLQLDLQGCIAVPLDPTIFVPAPGQGALALQVRAQDAALREQLLPLHQAADAECVLAERQLLAQVQGGCHAPLGAWARHTHEGMRMHLFYGPSAVAEPVRAVVSGGDVQTLTQRGLQALRVGGAAAFCDP